MYIYLTVFCLALVADLFSISRLFLAVNVFQVRLVLDKLYENKKIASATHNIYAYRYGLLLSLLSAFVWQRPFHHTFSLIFVIIVVVIGFFCCFTLCFYDTILSTF